MLASMPSFLQTIKCLARHRKRYVQSLAHASAIIQSNIHVPGVVSEVAHYEYIATLKRVTGVADRLRRGPCSEEQLMMWYKSKERVSASIGASGAGPPSSV